MKSTAFSLNICFRSATTTSWKTSSTSGKRSLKRASTTGTIEIALRCCIPTRITGWLFRSSFPSRSSNSAFISSIFSARCTYSSPIGVSTKVFSFPTRLKSGTPRFFSRLLIYTLSADGEINSASAALERLRHRASVHTYCCSFKFMVLKPHSSIVAWYGSPKCR